MSSLPIGYLTRKEIISACHRLHSPLLSDEQNKKTYGAGNNFHGQGHNYVIEVTLRGPIDRATGMVMNINDLKIYMKKAIMDTIDHKNIDKDVPYFKDVVSTAENVAVFIWDGIKAQLAQPEILYEVKVLETERNIVRFRGEFTN
ncbi:6-pyruvoyl tetrahydrobiopterin synthase-like [Thrips palmi]|uniref:6-pyruvoyltetrahydropterin synthase n=1 Tax=Thrips palmi TaxID=161013 RepID=A0A6P8YJM2_THRPL|nr:6-pyruvoyl tetrahydrobiopterin synthase-like [Thrips palmi]